MIPSINFHSVRIKPGTVMVSSTVFSKLGTLVESIKRCGEAEFFIEPETKTSLNITIRSGEQTNNDAFVLGEIEGYKFLTRTHYSFIHDDYITNHFFKVAKKQGYKELKQYIMQTLTSIQIDPYTLKKITLTFYKTEDMSIDIADGIPYRD